MQDWNQLAAALGVPEVERLRAAAEALEAAFRPLTRTLPHDIEPAVTLRTLAGPEPEDRA